MRRILALLFFCSSVCWAQYPYTYTAGKMEITSYCTASTNCWHTLPGLVTQDMDEGGDGWIVASTTTNNVYHWDYASKQWDIHHEIGSTWTNVAVEDQYHIFLLGTSGANGCTSPNKPLYFWNGSSAPTLAGSKCLVSVYVNKYGTQILEGMDSTGNDYYSSTDGSTWYQNTNFTGASFIYLNDSTDYCFAKNGTLYAYQAQNGLGVVAFSPAPSGTIKGCIFASTGFGSVNGADSTYNFMLVWTSTGAVELYNPVAGTWGTVNGSTATKVVGPGKANIVELTSSGPNHLNLFPPTMTLSVSGNWNGCPLVQETCPPPPTKVIHRISAHIYHSHELIGNQASAQGAPADSLSTSSTAVSAKCDPFFGDPSDPECTVNLDPGYNNEALCEFSNTVLNTPQTPPYWSASQDARSGDGSVTAWYTVPLGPGGDIVTVVCGTYDTCKPPTVATCPNVTATVEELCGGLACDPVEMEADAAAKCKWGEVPNSWTFQVPYLKDGNGDFIPNSCVYTAKEGPELVPESAYQIPCD